MTKPWTIDTLEASLVDLRMTLVRMCADSEGAHLGGSLSVLEILAAVHFLENGTPSMVLSKGHAALGLYGILNTFDMLTNEDLHSFCVTGSALSTHTNSQVPGVSVSTGSLGHGLGIAAGWALAPEMQDKKVYVILGDGETQEGSVPEAARVCGHLNIPNLIALVDHNEGQQTGPVHSINSLQDVHAWWRSMGWNVIDVTNGNSLHAIIEALRSIDVQAGPTVLLCHTIKGFGAGSLAGFGSHFVALPSDKLESILESMRREATEATS